MIHFKKTDKEDVLEIFDGNQLIGEFHLKFNGVILLRPKEPFRLLDAFGLNKELLKTEFKFKWIIVFCENKKYIASKDKLLNEGIERTFGFGTKIFLPRNKWETRETSNQLSFVFKEEQ